MQSTQSFVNTTIRLGNFASDAVSRQFFGANFLMGRDSFSGTYGEIATYIGAQNIRYPGGGIAEDLFNVTDPNRVPASAAGTLDTMSVFLAHCRETGSAPIIVLPTKRYLDDIERGVREISEFVGRVTSGEFGPAKVFSFEIGNEFYAASDKHPPMTADEYGRLASKLAVAVQEATHYPVKVSVQTGKTIGDNAEIMQHFDTAREKAAVTSLSYHDYPWTFDAVEHRVEKQKAILDSWDKIGVDAVSYLSEWNLGSDRNDATDHAHDYGMKQLALIVEMVARSAEAGIDYASIWAVQQQNKTALASNEGDGRVYAAAHLVSMLAESVPGTRVLDLPAQVTNGASVRMQAFEDARQVVVFLSARDFQDDNGPLNVKLALSGFGSNFSHVFTQTISAIGDQTGHRQLVRVSSDDGAVLQDPSGGRYTVIQLENDYDLVRVTLVKSQPMAQAMRPQEAGGMGALRGDAGHNQLVGGRFADSIDGQSGHDRVSGGMGGDRLLGQRGNDHLFGGQDDDIMGGGADDDFLFGDVGHDRLGGGYGNDRLRGCAGNDVLFGGVDIDELNGGTGNDTLVGGADTDYFIFDGRFGNDVVLDFQAGRDMIDLVNLALNVDFDALKRQHMEQRGAHVVISLDQGSITLTHTMQSELKDWHFIMS